MGTYLRVVTGLPLDRNAAVDNLCKLVSSFLLKSSLGIPKPITMTHGTFATFDYSRKLSIVPGRKTNDFTMWDSKPGRKFYSAFPPSHLAGFLSIIIVPIFSEASCPVLGPPLRPPSGQLVKDIMEQQNLKSLFIPPAIAEQILQEPGGLGFFEGLDFMYYAGGPLSQAAGDRISQATTLCQLYGSTETSQIPQLVPLPEDWAYMEWHPHVKKEMIVEDTENDVFELVLYMDSSTEKISALNYNAPGATEWQTRDLFKPHPSKPNLWRFHGRKDDIIVLSNSEKFFPVPVEVMVSGHPLVSGALVIGQGRFQAALLVEPKPDAADEASLIDQVWPLVEKANLLVPGQGRITRSMIIVTNTHKPFQRAAKGTIVRKLTEIFFEPEIDALYSKDSTSDHSNTLPVLESLSVSSEVEEFVRSIVLLAFSNIAKASNDDDMFTLGLDSLKTLEIIGLLKVGLRKHREPSELEWLSSRAIYSHPSIKRLAALIAGTLSSKSVSTKAEDEGLEESRARRMDSLIHKYTHNLTKRVRSSEQALLPQRRTIAVTGTTGSLGARILQVLSDDPSTTKIYCLDRAQDARQRHEKQGFRFEESKVQYCTARIGETHLGLDALMYEELTGTVDVIVHNAWKVDFNQILESFENDHIRGVRSLVDWAVESKRHARIVYISSVSSVSSWCNTESDPLVPEELIPQHYAAAHMGYGESKHVAELILGTASKQSEIPVSILRVGQIAGSTESSDPQWPVQEWVPSLVKTSKFLGLVPDDLPPIDWIPINKLSCIVAELTQNNVKLDKIQIYNLVNPRPKPWKTIVKAIKDHCGQESQSVSLHAWIERLQESQESSQEYTSKPALKMLKFFTQMLVGQVGQRYETAHGVHASSTMASLPPVNEEWMKIWLKQWAF